MQIPTISEISTSRDMTEAWGGYNHNLRIGDNEWWDMKNLTSDLYPVMSVRPPRGIYHTDGGHKVKAILAKEHLIYADEREYVTRLYINDVAVTGLTLSNTDSKTLISMGAYVIILPDKKYVNTADLTDYGDIEAEWNQYTSQSQIEYNMCDINGNVYDDIYVAESVPDPTEATLWLDTSGKTTVLKRYYSESQEWLEIPTVYVRIKETGIGLGFKQYDGIKIEGIDRDIEGLGTLARTLNGQYTVIQKVNNNYIVVVGILDAESAQQTDSSAEKLKITRKMPDMNYVIESGNRLWGCRYGTNENGDMLNEIYACKLGDFKNWNCYMGLSTDSYTASCGTDGAWTGAITYAGYPLFFKANYLHKVYGNYPANYQIQSMPCRGVSQGAAKSLAIVNERLYYKSDMGIMMYDGSSPVEISNALGDGVYFGVDLFYGRDPAAGVLRNKYYISLPSTQGNVLLCYDASLGLWHKEDNVRADAFCTFDNLLYYIDHDTGTIKTVMGMPEGGEEEDGRNTQWYAESGIITYASPDKKYLSRLLIRCALDAGAAFSVYARYDEEEDWHLLNTVKNTRLRSFSLSVRPRRCDFLRIKFVGIGGARIYSVCRTFEIGSDL